MKTACFPLLLLFLLFSTPALAQLPPSDPKAYTYCSLCLGSGPLFKKGFHIYIDYGQEDQFEILKDPETGELLLFNSVMGAVNYMAMQGWELVQVFEEKRKDRTLWVLRKVIPLTIDATVE